LKDLSQDNVIDEFDNLIFDETETESSRIRNLSTFANRELAKAEFTNDLNHQRVSYLNSLRIFDRLKLVTRDLLICDRDSYITNPNGADVFRSDMSATVEVVPQQFDLLPGYFRLPGGEIFPGGSPELFATADIDEGRLLVIPLKNIIKAEAVSP
jgi:hypothetical protein